MFEMEVEIPSKLPGVLRYFGQLILSCPLVMIAGLPFSAVLSLFGLSGAHGQNIISLGTEFQLASSSDRLWVRSLRNGLRSWCRADSGSGRCPRPLRSRSLLLICCVRKLFHGCPKHSLRRVVMKAWVFIFLRPPRFQQRVAPTNLKCARFQLRPTAQLCCSFCLSSYRAALVTLLSWMRPVRTTGGSSVLPGKHSAWASSSR
jgi:hypothetical protein